MSITTKEIDALRQEFVTQAINHRLIANSVARSSGNAEYCNECFSIALENIGRRNLSHIDMPNGLERDGVRIASAFIQGYLTAKNIKLQEEPTERFINHIDCFAQSEQGDFEGFIKMKKWFLERTPKHELERFIEETIGIAEYIDTQVSSPKLDAFCKELELLKPSNTDRFAMGTPGVDHAGENKEGDL
ncbi:hypothetical protein [Psychrobacter sp. AOP7-B1-24]|uniref:hypothetical protein n=1 Tax=Psychrobacter sp. AOP7-B1-24 TaxID=3457645 RepID=UPI00402BE3B0